VREVSAILAIAQRDLVKFLRDRGRIVATFIFPFIFVGIMGTSFRYSFGRSTGFDWLPFIFTGILAQTLWQSAAMGIVSLLEDRQNDFAQEMFVSPISRYSIVFGKILGESLVALTQGVAILGFGLVLGVRFSAGQAAALLLAAIVICIFGGAFGLIMISFLSSQRAAQQIFPFIMLPQFFLSGVFTPIAVLPIYLDVLSRLSPMRYAVDFTRNVFYVGNPDAHRVTVAPATFNLLVMAVVFAAFMIVGTRLFVRQERNR
jgi:ABC-2 type transport system permease protein